MKGLAEFVMKGPWQATLVIAGFLCLSFIIPLVGMLSATAFGLVVLRQGLQPALTVLALSVVAVALFGVAVLGSMAAPLVYAVLLWAPVGITAWVLRYSRRLEWALAAVVIASLTGVIAFYGLVADPAGFWSSRLLLLVQPLLDQAPPNFDAETARAGLRAAAHYATGFMAAGSALSVFMMLVLARWWQSLLYNPGGFRAEFLELRPSRAFAYGALGCGGLTLVSPPAVTELMWNLGLVFVALYLTVGIAVMHTLLSRRPARKFWLAGLYLLLFVIPQLAVPVVLVGFADAWVDWRRRGGAGA